MELRSSVNELEHWGITSFDHNNVGLPRLTFNLLRACNAEVSISATGHFLKTGIDQGQRVALVSFEHPGYLMSRFKEYGFYFDDELLSEQLIYLYYKPCFSQSINLATNYRQLFSEIKRLSKGDVSRIVFLNADALFNLETHLLTKASAENLMATFSDDQCAILGCYQAADNPAHQHLDEIGKMFFSSYLEIKSVDNNNDQKFELIVHKSPFFIKQNSLDLYLSPGGGFNIQKLEMISHG